MKRNSNISDSDIALFLDGQLSSERSRSVEAQIAGSENLRSELRGYEQVKALLAASPRLAPSMATDRFILQFAHNTELVSLPWHEAVLTALDAFALKISMVPRMGIAMITLGVVLGISAGTVVFIENKQAPEVSALEGKPGHLIAGNRLPLKEGAEIRLGIPIVTGQSETITVHRKDLFSFQLEENTEASAEKLSFLARFGKNEINLDYGTLLFKTEKLLPEGGISVGTDLFTVTNHGTVALVNYTPGGEIIISVLEGSVSVDFKKHLAKSNASRIFVKSLQEFTMGPDNPFGTAQPISQKALEQLTDFASERLILLGLPQNNAAAALVDSERLSAVFTYFNIPEANVKAKLNSVKKLFIENNEESLSEARQILGALADEYEKSGHLHVSAPLFLFDSSISSYLNDNDTALNILTHIYKNKGYSSETRALAQCAIGILQERQQNLDLAKDAYLIVETSFSNTSAYAEAKERLKRLIAR